MSLEQKIQRGIQLLDEKVPDWHYRVSVHKENFGMEYSNCCILGQLFGDFDVGRKRLGLSDRQSYQLGFISWFQRYVDLSCVVPFVGRRLNRAWRKAILTKRLNEELKIAYPRFLEKASQILNAMPDKPQDDVK